MLCWQVEEKWVVLIFLRIFDRLYFVNVASRHLSGFLTSFTLSTLITDVSQALPLSTLIGDVSQDF